MSRSLRNHSTDVEPLDPTIVAELDQLDAALRGDLGADDALAALVRDVRAQAPEFDPGKRAELTGRVAAGFPRRAARAKQRRTFVFGGGAAALAAGAAVLVFTLPSFQAQRGSTDSASVASAPAVADQLSDTSGSGGSATLTENSASAVPRAATPSTSKDDGATLQSYSATTPDVSSSGSSSGSSRADKLSPTSQLLSRKVEHAVDMAVRVKSGQLDDAAGKVAGIVRPGGGYVADSQVNLRTQGAGTASFTLQVATSRLDTVVAALSDLGTVTRQQRSSNDITSSFDANAERLKNLRSVRSAILQALGKATTDREIGSLKTRLEDNRRAIASMEREKAQLTRRTDQTTVALTLSAPGSGSQAAVDDDGSWSIGDAARDALNVLGVVAGALLVGAGAALPFAVLLGLGYLVLRFRQRRLREAALEG